jgi:hypothetical protein
VVRRIYREKAPGAREGKIDRGESYSLIAFAPVASCTFRKAPVSVEGRSNRRRFVDLAPTSNRVQTALSVWLGDGAKVLAGRREIALRGNLARFSALETPQIISGASLPSFTAKTPPENTSQSLLITC